MSEITISDSFFRKAIEAIDSGDIVSLRHLLDLHPRLVRERLDTPGEGYFKNPYLLWFIANNPIRYESMPANIVDITRLIITVLKKETVGSLREQLNYTLALVVTGRIPKECDVQIPLVDLLIESGANIGGSVIALANGNPGIARYLIERGDPLTLTAAVCLDSQKDLARLLQDVATADLQEALIAAAFYGKADMIQLLLEKGADPNAYIDNSRGFHSHATALHQAVWSGSMESVKVLVEAGARPDLEDRIYHSTPIGWAAYIQTQIQNEDAKDKYRKIETYLLRR